MRATEFTRPLETERLILRQPTMADVDPIHAFQSREDVCAYLLFSPRDRESVEAKVAESRTKTRLEKSGDYLQPTMERRDDGRVMGQMYLAVDNADAECLEIGWIMHPDYAGVGYATEAAEALLEFAFTVVGAHRVIATLDPANDASIRVCRRLGMRKEAHLLEDMRIKGEWADTGVYAILDREWSAAHR
ncbi:RimJ/RimL family protein N-acetyltransferase [Okibacterium sp. HSC-33S16]|uniref:GNAT family N-acetyltransferase n=1 Tax=Okibacterium sp. HSC-33S16 TaxID=2910965 RepID=UPI0020A143C9|nr:GNAT family protein [Okibacterium sp. HSC-33S16]MCP2032909.1 RimJ/RimL family protein N-acetyltransferase [Okibacterium sp. HSC-33S16]